MLYDNILQTIGNTPIVKLNNMAEDGAAAVYLKLEMFNPGGSVKDRIALNMIEDAEEKGLLKSGDTIIEPTSGNTGIGLALTAATKGYHLILTMPESMSLERRKLLQAYGAEIILTKAPLGMKGAIEKAMELVEEKGYLMLQQFENPANPEAHRKTTSQEILKDFGQNLHAFVAGIGTGGTITGVGEILKENINDLRIIGVEPEDSAVLSGGKAGPHMLQGIGAGFIPKTLNVKVYDEIVKVSNQAAFETAKKLGKKEGILAGISAGANLYAALQVAKELGKGKKVLTVIPDTGERYLSTTLFHD
ncbi:cysteine synthase A [Clostridium formicaceticum]|uniref:Cysteine synthase n=1 Tax=Clostridium formicaceticum TaxID=1497 RepID=A0AAC9RK04_9CLOT|nr:cysteine synthase A [Clostridium formicaceticum]AOY76515.1 cysteine synthase A [Clostridium formicaceticum]ARE86927.1 Cysteine synthase [Clostridium formicaceticum]